MAVYIHILCPKDSGKLSFQYGFKVGVLLFEWQFFFPCGVEMWVEGERFVIMYTFL